MLDQMAVSRTDELSINLQAMDVQDELPERLLVHDPSMRPTASSLLRKRKRQGENREFICVKCALRADPRVTIDPVFY